MALDLTQPQPGRESQTWDALLTQSQSRVQVGSMATVGFYSSSTQKQLRSLMVTIPPTAHLLVYAKNPGTTSPVDITTRQEHQKLGAVISREG